MEIKPFVDSLNAERNSLRLFIDKQDKDLQIFLQRYYHKIRHCNLIIMEILELMNQYHKNRKWLNERLHNKNNYSLNSEEQRIYNKNNLLIEKLTLNHENFYIHSRILLDIICNIIGYYIKELPEDTKNNFSKHQNFLKKNDCSDSKYKNYICESTDWYGSLLMIFRNNLVVHDEISCSSYSESKLDGSFFTIGKTKDPSSNEYNSIMNKLMEIKQNHKMDIPELENKDNLWDILYIIDHNANKITSAELKEILEIHKKIGGKFPDISVIINNIQDYLDFVGKHFKLN